MRAAPVSACRDAREPVAAAASQRGRDNYLGGLHLMTRQDDPGVLIKALRYAHDYTAQIDFSDLTPATETLQATNAFHEPKSDHRLTLPASLGL